MPDPKRGSPNPYEGGPNDAQDEPRNQPAAESTPPITGGRKPIGPVISLFEIPAV